MFFNALLWHSTHRDPSRGSDTGQCPPITSGPTATAPLAGHVGHTERPHIWAPWFSVSLCLQPGMLLGAEEREGKPNRAGKADN